MIKLQKKIVQKDKDQATDKTPEHFPILKSCEDCLLSPDYLVNCSNIAQLWVAHKKEMAAKPRFVQGQILISLTEEYYFQGQEKK